MRGLKGCVKYIVHMLKRVRGRELFLSRKERSDDLEKFRPNMNANIKKKHKSIKAFTKCAEL